jgi:hypothetical protein
VSHKAKESKTGNILELATSGFHGFCDHTASRWWDGDY